MRVGTCIVAAVVGRNTLITRLLAQGKNMIPTSCSVVNNIVHQRADLVISSRPDN